MFLKSGFLGLMPLLFALTGVLSAAETYTAVLLPRVDCEIKAPKAGLFHAVMSEGNIVKSGDIVAWLKPQPNSLPELRRAAEKATIARDRAALALEEYEKLTYNKELNDAKMQSLSSELGARKAQRDSDVEKGLAGIGASTNQKAGDKDLDNQARQLTLDRDRLQLQEKSRPMEEQASWKRLKLALREMQVSLDDALAALEDRAITAVEEGELVRLLAREAETVAVGAGVARIADASTLLAEFSLPAAAAKTFRNGNGKMKGRSGGGEVEAALVGLTATPDAVTRKVRAVLQVSNTDRRLAPGDELEIELDSAPR